MELALAGILVALLIFTMWYFWPLLMLDSIAVRKIPRRYLGRAWRKARSEVEYYKKAFASNKTQVADCARELESDESRILYARLLKDNKKLQTRLDFAQDRLWDIESRIEAEKADSRFEMSI